MRVCTCVRDVAALVSVLAGVVGCGSPERSVAGAADASSEDANVSGRCNDLQGRATTSEWVPISGVETMPEPAATGGAIVDGSYLLDSILRYAPPTGEVRLGLFTGEIRVTGDRIEVYFEGTEAGSVTDYNGAFTTSGTALDVSVTCMGAVGFPILPDTFTGYDAPDGGGAIVLHVINDQGALRLYYTRGP